MFKRWGEAGSLDSSRLEGGGRSETETTSASERVKMQKAKQERGVEGGKKTRRG